MRIGIPTWNGRVSPVLDTAERLLVMETTAPDDPAPSEIPLGPGPPAHRALRIAELELDLLICGAVTRPLARYLESLGVPLCPWVSGATEEVVSALEAGRLDEPRFMMPGRCGRPKGRRGERRRRGTQGPHWRNR
jgi:predicted Fe-Mo cluster-binding NifX family protein